MCRWACVSYLLAVGGCSLVDDALFNGCKCLENLVGEGFASLNGGCVCLSEAGWDAALGWLGRGRRWWLVGVPGVEAEPFVVCGDVSVAPFSWMLWEDVEGGFEEAYIVRGLRVCGSVWMERRARRPFRALARAWFLVERATKVYVGGGNRVYAWRLLEEAAGLVGYACRVLGSGCRVSLGGGFMGAADRLRRVIGELWGRYGSQSIGGSSSQGCV